MLPIEKGDISANRDLLAQFFNSAQKVLAPGGKILVSVKVGRPYDYWRVDKLAEETGLTTISTIPFKPLNKTGSKTEFHKEFDGYEHATSKAKTKVKFPRGAKTYIFMK